MVLVRERIVLVRERIVREPSTENSHLVLWRRAYPVTHGVEMDASGILTPSPALLSLLFAARSEPSAQVIINGSNSKGI